MTGFYHCQIHWETPQSEKRVGNYTTMNFVSCQATFIILCSILFSSHAAFLSTRGKNRWQRFHLPTKSTPHSPCTGILAADTITRVVRRHCHVPRYAIIQSAMITYFQTSPSDSGMSESHSTEDISSSSSSSRPTLPIVDEKVLNEVETLRRRAQELKEEARIMELTLAESRLSSSKKKKQEETTLLDKLFFNNENDHPLLTPEAVAHVMRQERWSADQALLVLDGLQDRLDKFSPYSTVMQGSSGTLSSAAAPFVIGDSRNLERNETENIVFLIQSQIDCLINAAQLLDDETMMSSSSSSSVSSKDDSMGTTANTRWTGRVASSLKSRRSERQRTRNLELQRQLLAVAATSSGQVVVAAAGTRDTNTTVKDYMRRTLGLPSLDEDSSRRTLNVTRVMEQVSMVPLWLPSTLLTFLIADKGTIDPADIRTMKEKVLTGSRFFCTSTDKIPSAAIFRGNIRIVTGEPANVTAQVFTDIQKRMDKEGLSDRIQLFFMQDAEWKPNRDEREREPKPVLLAVPASLDPDVAVSSRWVKNKKETWTITLAKRASIALSITATLGYSVGCFALNSNFFKSVVNHQDLTVLLSCIPIFVGLCAVQAIHELAHIAVARWRGIKIGRPLPVPSGQLGMFGCITPLRSFPANRSDLLDFALSGPMAAILTSIALMVFGINLTTHASGLELSQFPVVPVSLLKSSFLTGTLLSFLAPKVMMLPLSQPIPIHPFFMIGFSGLLSSALNLLPIFRLDGGRACSAAMGSRFGAVASAFSLLFMLSLILSGGSSLAFTWALFIVFFQRRPEIPPRDDVTQVDDFRLGGWIASLTTAVLALAPFPGGPGVL